MLILVAATLLGLTELCRGGAQPSPPALSTEQIRSLMKEVAGYQQAALLREGTRFRYRTHRVDPKEDTTRDLIESADGNVARLVLHNGRALTTEEARGERERLEKLLASGDAGHRQKEEQRARGYGVELIRAMPEAMLYTITAGQPQLPGVDRRQLVVDFSPDPAFQPQTIAQGLLSGMAGRLWVDESDHHLVRIEINLSRDLTLAWGMLIKAYKGGTIEYEQRRIQEKVYCFSHVRMHLRLREFMVKTAPYESDLTAFDVQPLSPVPSGVEAVRTLLNEAAATR